jgi:5-methylcytosine-specific restriction endonuclease McrA
LIKSEKDIYKHILATQDRCALCGSQNESQLIMHHIRFGAGGRKTYIGNVIRLCTVCHLKVHSNDKRFRPILIKKINTMEGLDED